jgi:hypothetical protein
LPAGYDVPRGKRRQVRLTRRRSLQATTLSAAICRVHQRRKSFGKLACKGSKSKAFQSFDLLWPRLDSLQIDFYGAAVFEGFFPRAAGL